MVISCEIDKELMVALLSDARSLVSRNISGGKYDCLPHNKVHRRQIKPT